MNERTRHGFAETRADWHTQADGVRRVRRLIARNGEFPRSVPSATLLAAVFCLFASTASTVPSTARPARVSFRMEEDPMHVLVNFDACGLPGRRGGLGQPVGGDHVLATVVPEPGTLSLLALAGLAMRRSRFK
jgi:hypothetical protein